MSLKLNERYPGRFNNPSADYPGGSFKNRTSPDAKDGSYLEKDWANDKEGFFQSLLAAAVIEANGSVDKVGSSQYYDALMIVAKNAGTSWNKITEKPTTISGYGITDAMPVGAGGLMTMLPALNGKIIDLTANQFFTIGAATTDKPSAITYGVGMHLKYPDQKYAFDLASGTTVEWFGVRQVSSDGSGSWRKLYTSADFDPANKADKATTLAGYTIAIASQVDAEGGTDNALPMTPLRVFQAIAKVVTQATETAFGWAKVATQAMVNAGTDDAAYVTSKKIRGGFIFSFAANGYIFLPAWMGGFGMQWGVSPTILPGTPLTQSLPIAFPVANLWCIAGGSDASTGQAYACNALPLTTSTIRLAQAYGTTIAARYFAIGY